MIHSKILPLPVLILYASLANGQELIHSIDGKVPWGQFGHAVDGLGDVNADGYGDFIVGEPDGGHGLAGKTTAFSGLDGSPIHVLTLGGGQDRLGFDIAGLGDVNADGIPDYAVIAPDGSAWGTAYVRSGVDGSAIHTIVGTFPDVVGLTVAAMGDIDGDGLGDFALSVGFSPPIVELRSGATGSVIYSFPVSAPASALSSAGDVNADGFTDVINGDMTESGMGSVAVHSGADGHLLWKKYGEAQYDGFGVDVDGLGDVNGDGYDDIVAGATQIGLIGSGGGLVRVHSGMDGAELYRILGETGPVPWQLGRAVVGAGDLDMDGVPDFAVSAPNDMTTPGAAGTIQAYSGVDGGFIFSVVGSIQNQGFGWSLAASDINGDGTSDLIVGIPVDDTSGTDSGFVQVFSGRCPFITPYGAGCPGSSNFVPRLTGGPQCSASPGETVGIFIDDALGGSAAILLFGQTTASVPVGFGCTLNVSPILPIVVPVPLGGAGPGAGSATIVATIPATAPAMIVTMQAIVQDAGAALGHSASNGLRLDIF